MTSPSVPSALLSDLRSLLGTDRVLSDESHRKAYSYDAGIHKIWPAAVVLPETGEELSKIVGFARRTGVPLTPRSAGTNLTGAAIGSGIVVGMARMNRIDLSCLGEGTVRVGPGVILKELSDRLARLGYFFPPDPSSAQACQIGGMIGTNAAGAHALKYGAMKDNVRALSFLDERGELHLLAPLSYGSWEELPDRMPVRGFRELLRRLPEWSPLLISRMPHVSKNSSGYNLFDLAMAFERGRNNPGKGVFDPVRLIVGSEGTLGFVTEASLGVLPLPKRRVTLLAYFLSLGDLGAAVRELLALSPSALEMMDRATLDLIGRSRFGIPEEADSLLLIEFDSEPQEDLIDASRTLLARYPALTPLQVAVAPEHQKSLWKARHSLFPTLYRYDGIRRPINFADDVAVPVERLPELLAFLRDFFREERIPVAVYGHIGNGNAHINPLLNVREEGTPERLLHISQTIHREAIARFQGVPCGEHGEGRVRAEFLPMVYGEEIYGMFREVKRAFDPEGILNPGVKISTASFLNDLDLERVARPCATCGKCNTVCPPFDVLREETSGARGWYQILSDPSLGPPPDSLLDACLNCKSCRATCPAGVDVSRVILDARAKRGGDPVSRRLFRALIDGRLDRVVPLLGQTQGLWDRPLSRSILEGLSRRLLKRVAPTACIPRNLRLPDIRKKTLRERFRSLTPEGGRTGDLAYFHGCAARYFDDGIGEAVISLLMRSPRTLVLPPQTCSGTPIETYGHADLVREAARRNLETLSGYPVVVTGCASCTLALKDMPELFSEGSSEREKALILSSRVRHISEYMLSEEMEPVLSEISENTRTHPLAGGITYHESCHLRAAGVTEAPHRLIGRIFGADFRTMADEDRCAGGAGSYLVKNPELSGRIFERKRAAVASSGARTVTTGCPACQMKLQDGLGSEVDVAHMAILMARALDH